MKIRGVPTPVNSVKIAEKWHGIDIRTEAENGKRGDLYLCHPDIASRRRIYDLAILLLDSR